MRRIEGIVVGCLLWLLLLVPHAVVGAEMGWIEVRVTDDRPGIDHFFACWVELAEVALHRKGMPDDQAWEIVLRDTSAVDIVPLKDDRWALVGKGALAAGPYDAVRIRFSKSRGTLLERAANARPPPPRMPRCCS